MKAIVLFMIFVFAFIAFRVLTPKPSEETTTTPVVVDHPVAECPGCVGPSVDNQPQPVYPIQNDGVGTDDYYHRDYVPTTKPVPYHETQPGPPFSPKFGEPKQ